jgi:hypothetical protein
MDLDRAKGSQRCGTALIGMSIRACPFEILYVNRYMMRESSLSFCELLRCNCRVPNSAFGFRSGL